MILGEYPGICPGPNHLAATPRLGLTEGPVVGEECSLRPDERNPPISSAAGVISSSRTKASNQKNVDYPWYYIYIKIELV